MQEPRQAMFKVRFLQLLSVGLFLYADICDGAVPPCGTNWFGYPCRYKCHCTNNNCNYNGECTYSSVCENGWFGPACQYVDLVSTKATYSTPSWVYDFPDTLCNQGQETITVSLQDTFFFTWLRLRGSVAVRSQDFKLQLLTADRSSVSCGNVYTSQVSESIVDMHCQSGAFFQQIIITGIGVKSLCSVRISGGRNVALGQDTTQTSYWHGEPSWKAVDGNSDSSFDSGSCTHTDDGDSTPTWTLTLSMRHYINRYVIYNRNSYKERLWGLYLEAYLPYWSWIFTYTDLTNTNHDIYRIQSNTPEISVSKVKIVATHRDSDGDKFLTLCEVEMFGDTDCSAGHYGRECEKTCNCAKSGENCFVSTGGCPSGCAAGYQWENCRIPCLTGKFGVNCNETCSTNCSSQLCSTVTGKCGSCVQGLFGDFCNQTCLPTKFGKHCRETCSTNCSSQLCDAVTGKCASCVQGLVGDFCNQTCLSTKFGENCSESCSTNCSSQLCDAVTGNCASCVPGLFGDFCNQTCLLTTFGENCTETCSTNCSSQLCDAVTGKCASCVQGLFGDLCDQTCHAMKFGKNCRETCSTNCSNQLCDAVTGKCASCVQGSVGDFCNQTCSQTTFGENCSETCSTNCSSQLCDAVTGKCASCVQGWDGDFCNQTSLVDEQNLLQYIPVIVGPVVAFIVLITVIAIGVLIWRRRRNKRDEPGTLPPCRFHNNTQTDSARKVESYAEITSPYDADAGQYNIPDDLYEIPMRNTAQTQNSSALRSQDHVSTASENPYVIMDNGVNSP